MHEYANKNFSEKNAEFILNTYEKLNEYINNFHPEYFNNKKYNHSSNEKYKIKKTGIWIDTSYL